MWKILRNLLASILLLLLTGCACLFRPPPTPVPDPAHYSQNALDWQGVYTARLTESDVPSIMLLLQSDETFLFESTGFSEIKGSFRWLDGGNAIELALPPDSDWPSLYRVGENRLTPVSPVTGPHASNFLIKESDVLKETIWQLHSSEEGWGAAEQHPYLIVKALGNQISGHGGCNNFFGNYSQSDNGGISFFNIASTKMACPALQIEQDFIQNLSRVVQSEIGSDGLLLYNIDGEIVLKLKRQNPIDPK